MDKYQVNTADDDNAPIRHRWVNLQVESDESGNVWLSPVEARDLADRLMVIALEVEKDEAL